MADIDFEDANIAVDAVKDAEVHIDQGVMDHIDRIWATFHDNGKNLDFDEFKSFVEKMHDITPPVIEGIQTDADLHAEFAKVDTDGSGLISKFELTAVFSDFAIAPVEVVPVEVATIADGAAVHVDQTLMEHIDSIWATFNDNGKNLD